jgi:hypothetical protein
VESPSREVTLTVYFFFLSPNTPRQDAGAAAGGFSPSFFINWQRSLIRPPSSIPWLLLKDMVRPRHGGCVPGLVAGDGKVPILPLEDQTRETSLNDQYFSCIV